MSIARRTHRILGLLLLLPICGWAITGFVFFIKPGYQAAYSALRVHQYPLELPAIPVSQPGWLEVRTLRTVLGGHLLVRTERGRMHLDPETLKPRELPDEVAIKRLLQEATAADRARYGDIASITRVEGETASLPALASGPALASAASALASAPASASAVTTTGVEIDLDWTTLALSQSGKDTRTINALYRIHYLQWTGFTVLDRVLGVAGLVSLIALAVLGFRLAFRSSRG